ncbi:response regulator [Effusibacillus pohliae]|uniref:response regulator n=1 Tax=Effusibacillus pohliae TaxID=232270 RepID=UPI00036BB35C|nr:response regulator [Effusibacillus pohliae]
MRLRFFLIEDDPVTRKMLERIIAESGLGEVVGQAQDGLHVSIDHLYHVDVVLIDLLMPGRDGIETIKTLREEGFEGRFIMISQVENKEMVGEAYLQGVDTFIHKPVNRLEVLAVLRRVADHLSLASSLNSIRQSLRMLDEKAQEPPQMEPSPPLERKVRHLLLQLGIAGEAGAPDLLLIMRWLSQEEQNGRPLRDLPQLKELYLSVLRMSQTQNEQELQKEARAMEQRIRRTVLQAFSHLASIGLTDYANPIFEHFAPRLFDFQEVRLRMQEIENGEKNTRCRINVRKFLAAFYMEVKQQ